MKKIGFMIILLLTAASLRAQDEETLKRIESAKIGLISERLGLSPEQAEKFWPIYNEFSEKRMAIRQEMREARRDINPETASEEERQKLIERGLELREREVSLEKEYSERLLKVIDSRQLISLRKAEDDFRDMLLRRIEERQRMQDRREQQGDRMENRIRERRNN